MADAHELMQQTLRGGFRDRVRYFAVKAAIAVMNEGAPTAERLAFARAVLQGADVELLTIGVLTDDTIAAKADGSADADVEGIVGTVFTAFAKAGAKA
jgi:hypothetical protein